MPITYPFHKSFPLASGNIARVTGVERGGRVAVSFHYTTPSTAADMKEAESLLQDFLIASGDMAPGQKPEGSNVYTGPEEHRRGVEDMERFLRGEGMPKDKSS